MQSRNQYEIVQKIKTLAECYDPFEIRGFLLEPWEIDWASGETGGALVATKTIEALDVHEAIRTFREDLFPVVDRFAVVSQCFAVIELEPFRILKLNENDERAFFLRYGRERKATPLIFGKEELEALEALDRYEEVGNEFACLRETVNATSFYTTFSMMVAALEGMAGEIVSSDGKWRRTNRDLIADEILKDRDLTEKIFASGSGLRNQLLHGRHLDFGSEENLNVDYIDKIYNAILRYFSEKCGANINQNVVNPRRTPTGHYVMWNGWLKPISNDDELSLKTLCDEYRATHDYGRDTSVRGHFSQHYRILEEAPVGY